MRCADSGSNLVLLEMIPRKAYDHYKLVLILLEKQYQRNIIVGCNVSIPWGRPIDSVWIKNEPEYSASFAFKDFGLEPGRERIRLQGVFWNLL